MYFEIHISPSYEASSDIILVDNFHPLWKEAAQKLMQGRIIELMDEYKKPISEWVKLPLELRFDKEVGLNHIITESRSGLDLWPEQKKYRSHNIHSPSEVCAATAIITNYINWLNFVLRDLEGKVN